MDYAYQGNDISHVIDADRENVWHHITQHKKFDDVDPMVIVEGKGLKIWNAKGREMLDATSGGVWTVNVGYGREEIANAVRDQILKMNFFSGAMGTIPAALFSKQLLEKMPGMSRVYYSNSGTEANEKSYKIVRQIAHKKYDGKKYKILYRDRDYHGTSITALASGGHGQRKHHYGPFTPGFEIVEHCLFYRAQWDDVKHDEDAYGIKAANSIEEVILKEGPDTVGGIILEPITAGGGIIVPPNSYWQRVQEICKKYDVLLIIDEVVCGMGRTGTWFGYQQFDVKPDIVNMAKGVASGYAAISCTVTTEDLFQQFRDNADDPLNYFRDISTFGGCTAGPAAAITNMNIIERENLLDNVKKMGAYLSDKLQELKEKHDIIGQARGMGLLQGIELIADRETKEPMPESHCQALVAHAMQDSGVLVGATNRSLDKNFNNVILFSPAFVCTKSDIDHIVTAVDKGLSHIKTLL